MTTVRSDRTHGARPIVGRDEELAFLRSLRSSIPPVSAVITGSSGVGKSRLAAASVAEATQEHWGVLTIHGSTSFGAVPLGPLRTALGVAESSDAAHLATSIERALLGLRTTAGLLVWADDAQDLDDSTAGLLAQMVATGSVVGLFTIRSGVPIPGAITGLWKDGRAERMELQNLSSAEASNLLAATLGGPVEVTTSNRIWRLTEGNPIYLDEVVRSGLDTGSLRQTKGEWQWRGQWATGIRLHELVAIRLGRIQADQSGAMEYLALAGSLPMELLARLTNEEAVEELETLGLVSVDLPPRFEVTIDHPLHAEVIRQGLAPLRRRGLWRNLVEELHAIGPRSPADRVRLAWWSLEAGLSVDPVTLAEGRDASLFAMGHAISARLRDIFDRDASGLTDEAMPAIPADYRLGIRMAEAAYERTGHLDEGVALVDMLAWAGEVDRATEALVDLDRQADNPRDRHRIALALAWIAFWGRQDDRSAIAILEDALDASRDGGDRRLRADTFQQLASIALMEGRPADALDLAQRSAAEVERDLSHTDAASSAAGGLSFLGRFGDSIELIDRAVPIARDEGRMRTVAALMLTRAGALARLGKLEEARKLAEWLRDLSYSRGLVDAASTFGVMLGEVLLRQGRPASAARILRDSAGLLAGRDVLGYRPWALYSLARAKALTGDPEAAADALAEGRRVQAGPRHFDFSRYLAEMALQQGAGRREEALDTARAAARWAGQAGIVADEAAALDECIRLAPDPETVARLEQLAGLTDSPLVEAMAQHARAVLAADPDALLEVAARFADMSCWWRASEAAISGRRLLEDRSGNKSAAAAAAMVRKYAGQCEGKWADALPPESAAPSRLTKREHEIAARAAAGYSSKQIAEQLFLSPRTVENHLYRVYVKLGVTDRSGLADALSGIGN